MGDDGPQQAQSLIGAFLVYFCLNNIEDTFYSQAKAFPLVSVHHHFFPFGEYFPLSEVFPFLPKWFRFNRSYTPGNNYRVMNLGGMGLIPSLCYESVFSSHTRRFIRNEGNLIVNMTNDGWWGRSDLPMVHMAVSIFRTVEYRVQMVRVTNSGVGAFVEATGEIVAGSMTPMFEEAVTSFPLFIPEERSPYFYLGDWFLWSLLVLFTADLIRHRFK